MTNSAGPDQLASSEANSSGSTLFAKAGYVRVQQDKCKYGTIYQLGHYENTPIQIYRKFHLQKLKIFS